MKNMRKGVVITAAAMSALVLAACGGKGGSSSDSGKGDSGKTVVSMYMPGDKPKNYDDMIAKANKTLQKKYPKVAIDMKFIGWGDYGQKYSVMVTSGTGYDLAFAQNYPLNAQKGAYADMTDMLKTTAKDAYDGVDAAYWKGLTVKGKIYGFPINANVFAQNALAFNGDFLKKNNIDISKINSYQDMEPALEAFHKANPGIAPFAIGKDYKISPKAMEYPLSNSMPFAVDSTGKDKTVVNPYTTDEMMNNMKTLHDYYKKGLIPQDAATASTQYNLNENTWFVRQETTGPFDYGSRALMNAAGGKDIQTRPITDPYKSSAQAQVAIWSISKTSKHKKEAMQVLNALNTDKELLNNIVWGLQGKQWNFTDEDAGKIKLTKDYKPGYFIGAWMMGNNSILYTEDSLPQAKIEERDSSIKAAKESAALGFMPSTDNVKTEVTNISNVMSKYADILNTGTADPEPTVKKMVADLKTAGWDKVQKDLQKQYDAFLADK